MEMVSWRMRVGDVVGVVAPASAPDPERLAGGLRALESRGLQPRLIGLGGAADGYLAAADEQRLSALQSALDDPGLRAVWAARGGYGISRILGDVRFPTRARPPLLVGFSDVSLLLARAWAAGLPCVHGPNVTTLGLEDRLAVGGEPTGDHPFDCAQGRRPSTFPPGGRPLRSCLDEASRDALFAFLLGGQVPDYGKLECLHGGCATGPVLPMNLSLLASVSGTPLCPSLDGVILLLEDVSEPAYRVDRLLLQVVLSGGFDRIAGLVLGDFEDALEHRTLLCSIRQWTSARRLPCVMGFPMGHGARNFPVPVGWTGDLDAAAGRLALRVPAPGSA